VIRLNRKVSAARSPGSLVCVGIGITLGSHITPLARSCIEKSDVVFAAVSDGIVELWLTEMHADVRSLQPLYGEGKSRLKTYREMVNAMMAEVRAGKKVCAAFYGHPGVFAWTPHKAIAIARREGFHAHMEPGISAEDCLYADLGIDPGEFGCQHYEASQLLYYQRRIDTGAYLVLWQAGLIDVDSVGQSSPAALQVLVERLAQDYPPSHKVTIYRAATLPIHSPRIDRTTLRKLASARIEPPDTLVLAPARKLVQDTKTLRKLDALEPQRAT
jgi:precorrin-6B methylase 1